MEVVLKVTVLFTLVLALSFLIERFLELLKAIFDKIDSHYDWHIKWTKWSEKVRDKIEHKLRIFEYVKPKDAAKVLNRVREFLIKDSNGNTGAVPVLSGNLLRAVYIKVAGKIIGILAGIGLAFWMGIDLICIWQESSGGSLFWDLNISSEFWRIFLSGVIMGLGSGPVHKIITTIEKKQKDKEQKGVQA